ncbi:hypothetical protein WA026_002909 [Henosepilachna vigintioctopunctata]|uniref:Uncharacterized protein n=1 Tax=Henosepilachna vigintioctopunctata TaxID=420089 RepID=A0AAW1TML0_9CUCU
MDELRDEMRKIESRIKGAIDNIEANISLKLESVQSVLTKIPFYSSESELKNCRRPKETGINITPDLTKTQQERNKILKNHLRTLMETTTEMCYIKGDKIYYKNQTTTVEDILNFQ